jgi:hypothetical protein
MTDLLIEFNWTIDSRLYMGSGAARLGVADRTIQRDAEGLPLIRGDAVKGVIRRAAEAWVRDLNPKLGAESEETSLPPPGVMQRVFAPGDTGKLWRFCEPVRIVSPGRLAVQAATRIDPKTRIAQSKTLHARESWDGGVTFRLRVEGYGLNLTKGSDDWYDTLFVLAAIGLAEQVGGGDGTGLGQIRLGDLHLCPPCPGLRESLADEGEIEALIQHLGGAACQTKEGGQHGDLAN